MKLLIGIRSCARDQKNGFNQVCRDTWIPTIGPDADVRFFVGQGSVCGQPDEVYVDAPDSYIDLVAKQQKMVEWALLNNYDFAFFLCTDVYIVASRLWENIQDNRWTDYDYVGSFHNGVPDPDKRFFAFGSGYWLSRKAMKLVASSPAPAIAQENEASYFEDVFVGSALAPHVKHGLKYLQVDLIGFRPTEVRRNPITYHLSQGFSNFNYKSTYDPAWMRTLHNYLTRKSKK